MFRNAFKRFWNFILEPLERCNVIRRSATLSNVLEPPQPFLQIFLHQTFLYSFKWYQIIEPAFTFYETCWNILNYHILIANIITQKCQKHAEIFLYYRVCGQHIRIHKLSETCRNICLCAAFWVPWNNAYMAHQNPVSDSDSVSLANNAYMAKHDSVQTQYRWRITPIQQNM